MSGDSGGYQMAELHQNSFVNTIGMKFKLLRSDTFVMGSLEGAEDEMPVHLVSIVRPFYVGVYEVTQEQWKQVMGKNPSEFEGDKRPVENVSWNEVLKFIKKLSEKEGIQYRLPTEAEWEYACRAGSTENYCFGNDESLFGEYAWYTDNSEGVTHNVGTKKPNAWGLYDMHGNVWEWCADWYSESYENTPTDGTAYKIPNEKGRVLRGGSWNGSAENSRCSSRINLGSGGRNYFVWFLLLIDL